MNKKLFFVLNIALISGFSLNAQAEKPYPLPQHIQCVYSHDGHFGKLRCDGINHNYIYEVLPFPPVVIAKDQIYHYEFSDARTGSVDSLQALLMYRNPETKQQVGIQTSYLPIVANVKKGAWKLEPKGQKYYICEGKASDCPITHLPF